MFRPMSDAVAAIRPTDSLAVPLGPGVPGGFLHALGERDDFEHLEVFGALLPDLYAVFTRAGVHYRSGFFGPAERFLRDTGASVDFVPADFRRFEPVLHHLAPRVMATAAAMPVDGWVSLSVHAGATVDELHAAGSDPGRVLIVECSPHFPRTFGLGEEFTHRLHVDEIDIMVESDRMPLNLPDAPPSDAERAIAEHALRFLADGCTLQTGIGGIPSQVAKLLAEGPLGDFGIHSEMFTTGLMHLHRAGKVTNRKQGRFDGYSITTFAAGVPELYEWLDENDSVRFLPVRVVNSPDVIAQNRQMVTINGALGRGPRRTSDRRHHRWHAVLRGRRSRGLRQRTGAVGRRKKPDLPAFVGDHQRPVGVADPSHAAVGVGGEHTAPPGRCRHHRVRHRRVDGPHDPRTGVGAGCDRTPRPPRRTPRGGEHLAPRLTSGRWGNDTASFYARPMPHSSPHDDYPKALLSALQHEHRLRTEAEDLLRAIHRSRTNRLATRLSSLRRGSAARRVIPDFLTSRPAPSPLLYEAAADLATIADYTSWFHQHGTRTWQHTHFFGTPLAKMPTDLWIYQEILWETKPQLIIECGTFRGGSALYFASLFDLFGEGEVVTVDVEPQPDRPTHPRITYLSGSSTAPEIAEQLRARAAGVERVMVILDSDHSEAHVAGELELYAPLVTKGCYLVVEDSVVNGNPILPNYGAGPMEALHEFLPSHPEFRIDAEREKFGATFFPSGFLERIA